MAFGGCRGALVGSNPSAGGPGKVGKQRQLRPDGNPRAAGEISLTPALCQGGCQAPARGPQGLRTQRCPFNHCGCKHIHHASPGTRPSRVQLPTRRPSTTLAVSHQGQGAGPWLVVPHGAAGRPPRHKGLQEQRAPASPLPGRELPVAEAAGAKQLRQHKSTVTAPERLSPGVRKNTS